MNTRIWVYCGQANEVAGYNLPSKEDSILPSKDYIEYIRVDAHEQIIAAWKTEEQIWRDADKKQLIDIERLRTELEATRTELVEVQRENARLLNDMERMIDFSIEINKDREELEALLRMHPRRRRPPVTIAGRR